MSAVLSRFTGSISKDRPTNGKARPTEDRPGMSSVVNLMGSEITPAKVVCTMRPTEL